MKAESSPSLSELPIDELLRYGRTLGLVIPDDTPPGEALRVVRDRQELLLELDRDAMLEVVAWLREPVRRSASREQLAAIISRHNPVRFNGLSDNGLRVLGRLSQVADADRLPREELVRRLRRVGGLMGQLQRARRRILGSVISKALSATSRREEDRAYHFLPEERAAGSLREDIEQSGLVGGVARQLKHVADDYVREKLDEIEARVDYKLDEIDRRLCEWRDREFTHRLRILKVTLLFSILVALLSLLYDAWR